MVLVWFIYGLAFFALGLAILIYPRKGSQFALARDLWMVGVFGLVHGVNEWLDMFIAIGGPLPPDLMASARLLTLSVSFAFLLQFGATVTCRNRKGCRFLRWTPLPLFSSWLAVLSFSEPSQRYLLADIWARYLLCIPAALLTAWGLYAQMPQFKVMRLHAVTRNLRVATAAFLIYGVLAGLFVRRADFFPANALNYSAFTAVTGAPIQVFRALCAAVAAWSIIRVLDVFRWETHERLRISEFRYGTIASAIPVFLFMTDRDLIVTFLQGRGLEVLGVPPEQAHGQPVRDVFPGSEGFLENCRRALSGKESVSVDFLGGLPFEISYSALRDETSEATSVVGVALNVSAQVQAQQEVNEYRREMEKRAREAAVGGLGAAMAREIAEPLSVIQLLLERVLGEAVASGLSPAAQTSIRKAVAETSKMRETVGRFLNIAHPHAADSEQPAGLYQIARRTVSVFAESARHKGLVIAIRDMDQVPLLAVSPREVEQIFYHLIQRVVDAAGGERQQKLVISCSASTGWIELTFSDTCRPDGSPGSDPGLNALLDGSAGMGVSGLGTAIVRQIVLGHGGEIAVDVQPEGVTTVRVRLPAKRVY